MTQTDNESLKAYGSLAEIYASNKGFAQAAINALRIKGE